MYIALHYTLLHVYMYVLDCEIEHTCTYMYLHVCMPACVIIQRNYDMYMCMHRRLPSKCPWVFSL